MNSPKRHHWWPLAQSQHWTTDDGCVFATRPDGSYFRPNPINICVESELYTRFGENDIKDTSVEDWFANTIDSPARAMIEHLMDPSTVSRHGFTPDPLKANAAKALGYRINPYIERIELPATIRMSIADYLAALLVRHPKYLSKLQAWQSKNTENAKIAKGIALDNMLVLFEKYRRIIKSAAFVVSRRTGTSEFLYSDGGILVEEPWREEFGIPFDIHAPITPDISLQVLPIPANTDLSSMIVAELTNQGVSRHNRIILGGANRFIFSRQHPPASFITKYFGIPAPKNIGYSYFGGKLESFYDPFRK